MIERPPAWILVLVTFLVTTLVIAPFAYYWGYAECDANLAATIDQETADALKTIAAAHKKGMAELKELGAELRGE